MTSSRIRTGVCGCKGARACLLCEGEAAREAEAARPSLYLCHNCGELRSAKDCREDPAHPPLRACISPCSPTAVLRGPWPTLLQFEGVTVVKEFITSPEEAAILSAIDSKPWVYSQSGRRKQDYGPKVNFKKQKVKVGSFNGLPKFIEQFVKRMREEVDVLRHFVPVELCNLDYHPERGAHIEAHRDDSWLWGERLVTLNLLSPVLLTFSHPTQDTLHPTEDTLHPTEDTLHPTQDTLHPTQDTLHPTRDTLHPTQDTLYPTQDTLPNIHVPLPQRSIVVVQGCARHVWLHSIERQNVMSRRVGITLRELTKEFLPGGDAEEIGGHLLEIARQFNGEPTNT